jgi:hypothetical protein
MLNAVLYEEFKNHYAISDQCEQEYRLMDRQQICLLIHSLLERIKILENKAEKEESIKEWNRTW